MSYIKNTDPNYFIDHQSESNCGSYAFNIQGWYDPEFALLLDTGSIEEWIVELVQEGWSDEEISELYSDSLVNSILSDFEGEIEEVNCTYRPNADEELIAFRTYCVGDGIDEWADWDFHFKVFRDGLWMEKCGRDPVQFCLEDEWQYGIRSYISNTVYFAHKISK